MPPPPPPGALTIACLAVPEAAGRGPQGYAMPQQIVSGIHTRLWARTFIVAEASDPG